MTDQQTYTDVGGNAELIIFANGIEGLALRSQVNLDDRLPVILCIPAPRLLAMIDTIDPEAMRAYLRETVEHEVPEADSPEDMDEQPDPVTFEWEDPPALNSPGSRPVQYWDGIMFMLRSRRGTWAKVGENVNPDSYRRQLRARGCEVTTRNRRDGNRCDVYARFPRSGGAR